MPDLPQIFSEIEGGGTAAVEGLTQSAVAGAKQVAKTGGQFYQEHIAFGPQEIDPTTMQQIKQSGDLSNPLQAIQNVGTYSGMGANPFNVVRQIALRPWTAQTPAHALQHIATLQNVSPEMKQYTNPPRSTRGPQ